ncbi:MAG: 16S rRNA (uracil(1498)-N(3))-methyltransferase [Phycisphaerales bacterium]|nr:16S rRNA (uracil(1498)-N(3))-methyltransferase [Phycisphaerales bacterium]
MTEPIHHRVFFSDLLGCIPPQLITIEGPEAIHLAKVKRARIGETVGVLDGQGALGLGEIAEITGSKQRPMVAVLLDRVEMVEPVVPRVQICCPAPKGDRLEQMIDQLTQIGVDSWIPLISDRSQRDPSSIRMDRIDRVIKEACKQCIRARMLTLHEPMTLSQAIEAGDDLEVIACDASGSDPVGTPSSGATARILIGPEGGWSDAERSVFDHQSVPIRRLGVHVLRLETAAVIAGSLAFSGTPCQSPFGEST